MLVVHLARNGLRSRLCGDEFDLSDQIGAPRFIDPFAEFPLHAFKLLAPGPAIGCDFQRPSLAANGPHMRGEGSPNDRRPCTGKPRKSALWPIHPTNDTPQKLPSFLHTILKFYHIPVTGSRRFHRRCIRNFYRLKYPLEFDRARNGRSHEIYPGGSAFWLCALVCCSLKGRTASEPTGSKTDQTGSHRSQSMDE